MESWVTYVLTIAGGLIILLVSTLSFFVKLWMRDKADRINFNKERIEHLEDQNRGKNEQLKIGRERFENHEGRIQHVEKNAVMRTEFEDYKEQNDRDHQNIIQSMAEVTSSVEAISKGQIAIENEVRGGIKAMTNIAANMANGQLEKYAKLVRKTSDEDEEDEDT